LEGILQVEGTLPEPLVTGRLVLSQGGLQPQGDAPPLDDVTAELNADAAGVTIRSFRGDIGGGPFEVTGGLRRGEDRRWTVDLAMNGENLLLYRTADIRVRADTELHLTGPVAKMALQGEVGLTNSRFRRNVDLFGFLKSAPPSAGTPSEVLFSLPDPPLRDMTFDVAIDSEAPVVVANNVVRGGLRPHLHLGGTGELPLLTGEIYVDPTRLRLPAGTMTIQSGVIRYLASQANRPVMDLQGEGAMFDYDITALIEGPLDEPQVTLSSSPPLPGDELMLMLLTGRPPADKNSPESRGVPMNLAVYIGQDLLLQWFGGESSESWTSILDRFDVIVGRRLTRAGDETLEAQFRLGEDVIRDGDSIYITGERDVFDFYNAGVKFVFRFK
jgi:translocation and assembly module TamB